MTRVTLSLSKPPRSALVAVFVVLFWFVSAVTPVAAELEKVTEVEGITEYRMHNGLKVLLFPDPTASTVTINVTYHVGSRHEGRGEKGMAHLLEHMVFKGTDTRENIWSELTDHGANFNGTTSPDRTNYYETLPASEENLDFALALEADRMVNSRISGDELAKEMTVVRNELELGENNPGRILQQRIQSAAYEWHNYSFSTIGNRSDLERVPVENLRRFYEKYYQPDNATLVVAGKIDPEATLDKIEQTFGAIPKPERVLEPTWTEEPTQDGPRRVELRRTGGVAAVGLAYHIPAGSDPEILALDVLSDVLSRRPSGRLYKSLVETGRAANVSAFAYSQHDPGLFLVNARVASDGDPDPILDAMVAEIEAISGSVTEEEVERAKATQLRDIKLAFTDSRRIGLALSEGEALGDWRLLFLQRDQLREVTADDVNRAAERYFVESNRTAGVFYPTDEPVRAEIAARPDIEALVGDYQSTEKIEMGEAFTATAENIDANVERLEIGGMKIGLLQKSTRGQVVHGALYFEYGSVASLSGHAMAASFLPPLLMRGAGDLDFQGLRDELDRIETQMTTLGQAGFVRVDIKTTRENLAAAIDLAKNVVRHPTMPESELETLREERLALLESQKTDPQAIVFTELGRKLLPYPPEDPRYSPSMEEQAESTRAVTVEEVRALHERFLGADNVRVSFVGDFDRGELLALLEDSFGGWTTDEPFERIPTEHFDIEAEERTFDTPDKQMAVVARAALFPLRDDDPAYPALRFANYVFGASPSSRLMTRLRHEGGLSYGAGSQLQVDDDEEAGQFLAFAICAPQNSREAMTAMKAEFDRFFASGLDDEEIEASRKGYLEDAKTALSRDPVLLQSILTDLRTGRDFRYRQKVVDAVETLDGDAIRAAIAKVSGAPFVAYIGGDVAKFEEQ